MAAAGGSGNTEEEERLQRTQDRLWRDYDPYNSGFTIHRTNARRQEAYDKCAPDVVALMKCVDAEGPAWFWRCNALHIDLQRCYNANKPQSPTLILEYWRDVKETATVRWEQAKWFVTDVLGDLLRGGRRGPPPPASSPS